MSSLLFMSGMCQSIDEIKSKQISISWAKTFHIIYPVDIKYFSLGDSNVVGEKVESCQNVIRLKANVRDFKDLTNLSVVTADSKYYSYSIKYESDVEPSYLNESDNNVMQSAINIAVCEKQLLHIIFPSNLKYVDYGDESIEVHKADGVENIVNTRARKAFPEKTNISVITEQDKFYTFTIGYQDNIKALSYIVDKKNNQEQVAILDEREMNVLQKDSIHRQIDSMSPTLKNLDAENGLVKFSIHNIMVKDNTIFIRMNLNNLSQINYSIDFIRIYIQDSKKSKRMAEQQIELVPMFYFDYPNEIKWKSNKTFTVALEKFTIPDKKECIIEIQEKGGGRHFYFKLKNKNLLDAEVLLKEENNRNHIDKDVNRISTTDIIRKERSLDKLLDKERIKDYKVNDSKKEKKRKFNYFEYIDFIDNQTQQKKK